MCIQAEGSYPWHNISPKQKRTSPVPGEERSFLCFGGNIMSLAFALASATLRLDVDIKSQIYISKVKYL